MAKLTAPRLSMIFREAGASLIARGERGIVALILRGTGETAKTYTLRSITDVPSSEDDTAENIAYMKATFTGYQHAPLRVLVYETPKLAEGGTASDLYTEAQKYFATEKFQYLAAPEAEADGANADIVSWVKTQRDKNHMVKAVLSNVKADTSGVINWTSTLYKDGAEVKAAATTPRIAGLLAGTDLTTSATYAPLNDYDDCERLESDEIDAHVGNGELVAFWDGEKVKLSRAITSLVTTTATEKESFQKIKLVEDMDLIKDDILKTIQDSYQGKFPNSYDNKCLLVNAVNAYLDGLVASGIINSGYSEIDIAANRRYLEGKGKQVNVGNDTLKDPVDLTDDEAKRAQTGSEVFLALHIELLDVMEDFTLDAIV